MTVPYWGAPNSSAPTANHLHHQRHIREVQPACNNIARKNNASGVAAKSSRRLVARVLAEPAVQVEAGASRGARQGGVELCCTGCWEEHDDLCGCVDGGVKLARGGGLICHEERCRCGPAPMWGRLSREVQWEQGGTLFHLLAAGVTW